MCEVSPSPRLRRTGRLGQNRFVNRLEKVSKIMVYLDIERKIIRKGKPRRSPQGLGWGRKAVGSPQADSQVAEDSVVGFLWNPGLYDLGFVF